MPCEALTELFCGQATFGRDDLAQVRAGGPVAAVEQRLEPDEVRWRLVHRSPSG